MSDVTRTIAERITGAGERTGFDSRNGIQPEDSLTNKHGQTGRVQLIQIDITGTDYVLNIPEWNKCDGNRTARD